MERYTIGKTAIAVLAALIIVATMSVSYAMWSDTLRINFTVNTGEVRVEWSDWFHNDSYEKVVVGEEGEEYLNFTTVTIEPEIVDDDGAVLKLNVTIDNAYPCYSVRIGGLVDNIGTIPVKLYDYSISGVDEDALTVEFIIPEDTQIDPGGAKWFYVDIHVEQPAEMNSTYTFEITLTFAQWNEVQGP